MNVSFRKSFKKDLRKLKDKNLLTKIKQIVENVETLAEDTPKGKTPGIPNFKKMTPYIDKYRIRFGDYRIGIIVENIEGEDFDIFWFERCLHRKDMGVI